MLRELHRWSDDAGNLPPATDAAVAALDRAATARVVVVAAPPGAGASESLRRWLRGRVDRRSAWLRLEPADADEPAASLCARIWEELRPELDHGTAAVPTVLVLEGIDQVQTARARVLVSTIACLPPTWQVVALSHRSADATVMPTPLIPYASLGPADLAVDAAAGRRLLDAAVAVGEHLSLRHAEAVDQVAQGWWAVWAVAAERLQGGVTPAELAEGWRADLPELVEVGGRYLAHLTAPEVHAVEDLAVLGRRCESCDAHPGPVAADLAELADLAPSSGRGAAPDGALHPVVVAAAQARVRQGSWARRHLHLLGDLDALRTAGATLVRPVEQRRRRADHLDLGARGLLLAAAGLVEQAVDTAGSFGSGDLTGLGDLVIAATAGLAVDGSALAAAVRLSESADRTWPTLRHLGVRSAGAQHRLARDLAAIATERIAGTTSDGTSSATDALRRAGVGARRGAVPSA